MRLRTTLLAAAGVLLLLAPAAAHADHGQTVDDPVLAQYMQIAASQWGGQVPHCSGRNGETIAPHAVMADDPDPDVGAWAELPGCRMWLDSSQWKLPIQPREAHCNLIAHEWGHLVGHDHSDDPDDLMSSSFVPNVVLGCANFKPAPVSKPVPSTPPAKKRKVREKHPRGRKRCVRVRLKGRRGRSAKRRFKKRCVRRASRRPRR
jgi:hypothetical protein